MCGEGNGKGDGDEQTISRSCVTVFFSFSSFSSHAHSSLSSSNYTPKGETRLPRRIDLCTEGLDIKTSTVTPHARLARLLSC